ncbi:MAG TPA: class I SAM-dependent methyltransferase, partial [Roseiflexaceae bacterium]|nr:class I SAM-dependent methyltransferase [Roseiflexaceae bacterium]
QGRHVRTSWDPVADWYAGWVGEQGSDHHRLVAIPALLDLLQPQRGEAILDVGAGPGVLAPYIADTGATYTGVDASERLLVIARRHHGAAGRFLAGDATRLAAIPGLQAAAFDAVTFLLSIQDMNPLEAVLRSAAWALRPGGRIVLLLTHPCFRVPRQSGWGWDEERKLRFRRIDRYLTPLAVPMKRYRDRKNADRETATRSFHRPLEAYINGLAAQRLFVEHLREIPSTITSDHASLSSAERLAQAEFPLFLALRARRFA